MRLFTRRKTFRGDFFSLLMLKFSLVLMDLNIGSVIDSHNVTTDTQQFLSVVLRLFVGC